MDSKIIVISTPEKVTSETRKIIALFECGLKQFHIRKADFSDFDMINFIQAIPSVYHKFLVLHSHYYLAKEFSLKGIQVNKKTISEAQVYVNNFEYFGYSAHSIDEIKKLKGQFTHFFLSPIYDSISKTDYKSNFDISKLSVFVENNPDIQLIALGGIDKNNSLQTLKLGFTAIAVLGSIWHQNDPIFAYNEIERTITTRPVVLSIAGFDPSSGAGITADIKTFEQYKVLGLGVNTAITYQNESEFSGVDWLSFEQVSKQVEILLQKYKPKYIKIGLIKNFDILQKLITNIIELDNEIKIIWDPILKASTGFNFHKKLDTKKFYSILNKIYLVTPNIPECEKLFGTCFFKEIQNLINKNNLCNVLVKGGHSNDDIVTDILIEKNRMTSFEGKRLLNKSKHGTGCVLSSAICANLSYNLDLVRSVKKAKIYITKFIDSNDGLLGFHNN